MPGWNGASRCGPLARWPKALGALAAHCVAEIGATLTTPPIHASRPPSFRRSPLVRTCLPLACPPRLEPENCDPARARGTVMGHPGALSPPPAARGAYELRNSGRLKACKRCEQRRCSNARINSRRSRMNGHVGENGL